MTETTTTTTTTDTTATSSDSTSGGSIRVHDVSGRPVLRRKGSPSHRRSVRVSDTEQMMDEYGRRKSSYRAGASGTAGSGLSVPEL